MDYIDRPYKIAFKIPGSTEITFLEVDYAISGQPQTGPAEPTPTYKTAAGLIPKDWVVRFFWEDTDDTHCRQCGAPNNDGEGWDGLCGNCADRAAMEEGI